MKRYLPLLIGVTLSIATGVVVQSCNDSMATSKETVATLPEPPAKSETVKRLEELGFNIAVVKIRGGYIELARW